MENDILEAVQKPFIAIRKIYKAISSNNSKDWNNGFMRCYNLFIEELQKGEQYNGAIQIAEKNKQIYNLEKVIIDLTHSNQNLQKIINNNLKEAPIKDKTLKHIEFIQKGIKVRNEFINKNKLGQKFKEYSKTVNYDESREDINNNS